ncbi:MAG: alginate export family protein [Candidatus Eisenbacteria bacterium]|mgnify:CR=1 FL=1|nr:alginate export family protein [Candidatus Eisenbacteria bacterium]
MTGRRARTIMPIIARTTGFLYLVGGACVSIASGPAPSLSDLRPGDWVEVSVTPAASGGWQGNEVDLKDHSGIAGGSLTGTLQTMADGRRSILGHPMAISASTAIKDTAGLNIAASALLDGLIVEAQIQSEGDGWSALKLKVRPDDVEWEIEGSLEAVVPGDPTVLRVLGFDIRTTPDTIVRRRARKATQIPGVDDDDVRPSRAIAVGPYQVGMVAGLEFDPRRNYDINSARDRNLSLLDMSALIEATARSGDRWRSFIKGGYRRQEVLLDERGTRAGSQRWQLEEAWIARSGFLHPDLAIQVGRQDFDEAHEWLYDENLDAIRLHWLPVGAHATASLSTRLDDNDPTSHDLWNGLVTLDWTMNPDRAFGLVVLSRYPIAGAPLPTRTWIGARALRIRIGRFRGWGDVSVLRGHAGVSKIRAQAAHLSTSFLLSRAGRLTLNAAWARGSGDNDPADGIDGTYRQTGFHDNNDRFGGVTGFRYYGEMLRPELSNLSVVTLGFGSRPTPSSSIDLVYHHYRQVHAAPYLSESNLDANPLGLNPDLGHEIDLIIGIREFSNMRLEGVIAAFFAGPAFLVDSETAVNSRLQVDVSF